jgi:hypothetical protein
MPGSPVSPVPGSPVAAAPPWLAPQPVLAGMPRPPAPPQRRPSRFGVGAAVTAAAVVVLLVFVGGTIGLYNWLGRSAAVNASASRSPSSPSAQRSEESATSSGPAAPDGPVPVKYDLRKVPANLCGQVDMTALAASFEVEGGAPSGERNVTTYLGTASCILSRTHNDGRGNALLIGTIAVVVYVFSDPALAVTSQQQSVDNAKLNGKVNDVAGIGDAAFAFRQQGNTADPGKDASYVLEARDANLRFTANFTAIRESGTFSDKERTDIESRFTTTVKASFAKATKATLS